MHTEKMLLLFPSPPVGGRIALAKKQLNARPHPSQNLQLSMTQRYQRETFYRGFHMSCVHRGRLSTEPLWLSPLMGGRWTWLETFQTNEGNMESVEVSHKQADVMLIVYFAL